MLKQDSKINIVWFLGLFVVKDSEEKDNACPLQANLFCLYIDNLSDLYRKLI